jgi:hypothetical protein
VKDLAKIDLDPNTVYNVSLSVTQGTKKFDNLRFFQTKTPKLFNIVPGQYSTFSRLTTRLEPITPVFGGGTLNPATLQTINVTKLTWSTVKAYDVSEGEASVNLDGSYVDFTITVARDPETFVFKVDGFDAKFACLNNRSDWEKVSGTTYKTRASVREFDPGATETNTYKKSADVVIKAAKKIPTKSSVIELKDAPDGVIRGISTIRCFVQSAKGSYNAFPTNTKVIFVQKGSPYYVLVTDPTTREIPKNRDITFSSVKWDNSISWTGGRTNSGTENPTAVLQYYSTPSFNPITRTYSFTSTSTVNSEVLNANVLDSLIWENEVRDLIYFFISDTGGQTWYYFDSGSDNGGITAARYNYVFNDQNDTFVETLSRISGADELTFTSGTGKDRVLALPPQAPGFVVNTSTFPSYPGLALKAKANFYNLSKKNRRDDATVPSIGYPVSISFAIARYIKNSDGITWSREWLGSGSEKTIKNVLSLEEQLS